MLATVGSEFICGSWTELTSESELRKAAELNIDLSRIELQRVRQGGLGKPSYFVATVKLVLELKWDKLWASLWWKETQLVIAPVLY
jgi:hypothetical protein